MGVQLKADNIAEIVSGGGVTVDGVLLKDGAIPTSAVPVTGTPDGTKYLRDDWSWQTVSGGSGLTHPQVLARGLGA